MKTVCFFFAKFASLITWTLLCFDRVIFKGHLPISRPSEFERFVDYVLKIRRADFLKDRGPKWSERPPSSSPRSTVGPGKIRPATSTRMPGPRNNCGARRSRQVWSAFCA